MNFQNKTVFITGASSGLGREMAIALSKEGTRLALFARSYEPLKETARFCTGKPILICGDVIQISDCKRAVEQTVEEFGQIDYLILNAGISMWSRFDEIPDPAIFQLIMNTNYLGSVNFCYHALPHLKRAQGMIVAISSIQGKVGIPYHSGYTASKHALQGFFDALRTEIQLDILVVSPSWIQGTNLKDNAAVKTRERKHQRKGLAPVDSARKILRAMKKRKRELYIPKRYALLPWIKLICPKWLDRLIIRKIG